MIDPVLGVAVTEVERDVHFIQTIYETPTSMKGWVFCTSEDLLRSRFVVWGLVATCEQVRSGISPVTSDFCQQKNDKFTTLQPTMRVSLFVHHTPHGSTRTVQLFRIEITRTAQELVHDPASTFITFPTTRT